MNFIKNLLKLSAIGQALIVLSLPYLHARSEAPVDVPINSLHAGAIVKDWVILGPLPNEKIEKAVTPDGCTRGGFHRDYLTELGGENKTAWKQVKSLTFEDEKGNPATVSPQSVEANWSGRVNLINYFPKSEYKLSYAFCRIKSEVEQTVHCYVGSNDGIKIWVNGELVHSLWQDRRGLMPREDKFKISLNKGMNSILLKSDQALFNWGYVVELFPEKPTGERHVYVPEALHHKVAALSKIRGREEIAYRSEVDGALQPMMIYVPPHYDAKKSWPLYVDLHGSGESHLTSKIGDPDIYDEDAVQIAVWGRGPRSGYNGLSEVDVLEAIDYVTEHWNVDKTRIHLGGHSMGGGGTFKLISRYPDRFASGRIWAGYNDDLPIHNMTRVPLYILHSDNDWLVPMSGARETMQRLSRMGGKVTWDMTYGEGHAVNGNVDANRRSLHWVKRQSRSTPVNSIHFTAMDELSNGAWWARILEWEPKRSYPTFNLSLGNDNTLYLNLDNIAALSLDITSSPIDRDKPLIIFLEGQALGTVQTPIPDELFVYGGDDKWSVAPHPPIQPKERYHVPGGLNALYHGEPLMIVWGTQGVEEMNKKIGDLAQLARATPNPGWTDKFDQQMQYSLLPGKPDTAVTDEDILQYNLILIGTAAQNSVVARLADDLPVSLSEGKIVTKDEPSWDFTDRGLGLLYFNPLNPRRLIYWIASNELDFYRSEQPLISQQGWTTGAEDFQLINANKYQRVAGRNFDSRWSWETGYSQSPGLPDEFCSWDGFDAAIKKAIQWGTGADYVLDKTNDYDFLPYWAAGETRHMDVLAFAEAHTSSLAVFELSGAEIKKQQANFEDNKRRDIKLKFSLGPELDQIDPDRIYTVGLLSWTMWSYASSTKTNPESFRIINNSFSDALETYLLRAMSSTDN